MSVVQYIEVPLVQASSFKLQASRETTERCHYEFPGENKQNPDLSRSPPDALALFFNFLNVIRPDLAVKFSQRNVAPCLRSDAQISREIVDLCTPAPTEHVENK